MRLLLTAEDVEASLQEQSRDAQYRIPAAVQEISHVKAIIANQPDVLQTHLQTKVKPCAGRLTVTEAVHTSAAAAIGYQCYCICTECCAAEGH